MKKVKKADILFIIALIFGLAFHIYFVFSGPFFDDESFYVTIPFRLVNGDSLISDEWHLSQFSALFSYIPVYLWTAIKGSADGIFVFLRFVYLAIHTAMAVLIYRFFRKYDGWAVITSMMFYLQVSYKTLGISYQSMFVIFLVLMSLCLFSIYENKATKKYILAGLSYGFCCVCNPIFCLAFPIYLISYVVWQKKEDIQLRLADAKINKLSKNGIKITKKERKEKRQQLLDSLPTRDDYNCFFTKAALRKFFIGIMIAAVVAVGFFFITGGTISSVFKNIEHLLSSSEYDIASNSVFSKFAETFAYLNTASLFMPWILLLLPILMILDKNRKRNSHRLTYLSVSVLWSIIFAVSILIINKEMFLNAVAMPFCLISGVCYALTENKNKPLFYCIFVPGLIGTFFQYMAANTHLAVIGVVLAACNVAGVFFAMDLWNEMRPIHKDDTKSKADKKFAGHCCRVIVAGICIQLVVFCAYYAKDRIYTKDDYKVLVGPYAGVYMTEEDYDRYNREITDMNVIKAYTRENDKIFLASYNNWMYMYLDRPISAYTTWYRGSIDRDQLIAYYKENSAKIPKYIYIEASDPSNARVALFEEMFEFSRENLSNGALLTVTGRKFY